MILKSVNQGVTFRRSSTHSFPDAFLSLLDIARVLQPSEMVDGLVLFLGITYLLWNRTHSLGYFVDYTISSKLKDYFVLTDFL